MPLDDVHRILTLITVNWFDGNLIVTLHYYVIDAIQISDQHFLQLSPCDAVSQS